MSFNTQSTASTARAALKTIREHADWNEQIVTTIATGLGVLIVALIAVLMGMT